MTRPSCARSIVLSLLAVILLGGCATNLQMVERDLLRKPLDAQEHQPTQRPDPLTIVFFADTQISPLLPQSYYQHVADRIAEVSPDLILIGGDLLTGTTLDWQFSEQIFGQIAALAPTYAVLGNHDHLAGHERVRGLLRATGIQVLHNRYVRLQIGEHHIYLAGVADLYTDTPLPEKALADARARDYVILLSHSPELYPQALIRERTDLMLAGHSHGGQVTLFGLWAPVLPMEDRRYWRGLYREDQTTLLVTNGVGVSRLPIRLCADPAIEVIRLY